VLVALGRAVHKRHPMLGMDASRRKDVMLRSEVAGHGQVVPRSMDTEGGRLGGIDTTED
jgi:hypothetical protein